MACWLYGDKSKKLALTVWSHTYGYYDRDGIDLSVLCDSEVKSFEKVHEFCNDSLHVDLESVTILQVLL